MNSRLKLTELFGRLAEETEGVDEHLAPSAPAGWIDEEGLSIDRAPLEKPRGVVEALVLSGATEALANDDLVRESFQTIPPRFGIRIALNPG